MNTETDKEKVWDYVWKVLEDDAMRQQSMGATDSRFKLIVAAGCEMRRQNAELKEKDAQLCRAREQLKIACRWIVGGYGADSIERAMHEINALSPTGPCSHEEAAEAPLCAAMEQIDVVFDGPPSHESGRFVEVENSEGVSISFGEWLQRSDGYWVLRFRAAIGKEG